MPVIKSAKKKLKQDKKRQKANNFLRTTFKDAVKEAQKTKTAEKVRKAVSLVDKAVKKGLIHKNKAARIKSRLSKLAKPAAKAKTSTKPAAKKKTPRAKK
ncbi:MAG: 30S ribosomal protein S20 [Candidatus Levyibacteriota bacterium]|jgi:small subunit ribosomal protein S20